MKINILKGLIILVIFIVTINTFSINTYAALSIQDIIDDGNSFLGAGEEKTGNLDEGNLSNLSNSISRILLVIALGVTLISGMVMGISFMTQSVEDKAKIKESLIPWLIGIIVSFGAYGIWTIAINVMNKIT